MKYKHTRGPWKFSDDSAYFKTNPFSVYVQGLGVHKTTVANIPFRKTIPEDEARANARLIAAAPELLDALMTFPQSIAWTDQELWDWSAKALAAIEKATGEQT